MTDMENSVDYVTVRSNKHAFYGVSAGLGILAFYMLVLTLFQGFSFATSEFARLWYWIVPLATGFGIQIGLYTSILHSARLNAEIAASGGVSGGSMIACCSHFALNMIPLLGFAGLATFLMTYQKWFFSIGIMSNVFGIVILMRHKKKMKGGNC